MCCIISTHSTCTRKTSLKQNENKKAIEFMYVNAQYNHTLKIRNPLNFTWNTIWRQAFSLQWWKMYVINVMHLLWNTWPYFAFPQYSQFICSQKLYDNKLWALINEQKLCDCLYYIIPRNKSLKKQCEQMEQPWKKKGNQNTLVHVYVVCSSILFANHCLGKHFCSD